MPTGADMISAGLDKGLAGDRPPEPVGELLSPAQLLDIAALAHSRAEAFGQHVAAGERELANQASAVRAQWDGQTDLPKAQRDAMASREIKQYRKAVVERTDKERWDSLRELDAMAKRASGAAVHYDSPAMVLSREGLGSEERSRYLAQVAHAGPVEVTALMRAAIGTKNRVLGAALASRLDSMRSQDRKLVGVSRQRLADDLVGADYKKAIEAIAATRNRAQGALNLNRTLESGKSNGTAKISLGLARRSEGTVLADATT